MITSRPARQAALALAAAMVWALLPAAASAAPLWPVQAGGRLTVVLDPPTVRYGDAAVLRGRLTDDAGAPVAGAPVVAEAVSGGTWTAVSEPASTDAAGAVALPVTPTTSSVVRLRRTDVEAASSPATLRVRSALTARAPAAVRVGRTARIEGTLAPAPSAATVRVQRRSEGRWRTVTAVPVAPDGSWSAGVPSARPGFARYRVVRRGAAGLLAATVRVPAIDVYRVHTYSVATRGRVVADVGRFRREVAATYADPRGWLRSHRRFREVGRGGDFTVVLAQARYLPTYSSVCSTTYSCRVGRYVIINQNRWRFGSPYFPGDLTTYRRMVVNHETGHWLGRGHAYCPRRRAPAPVMQQQSKGMQGCRPNAWPLPREVRAVS